MQWLKGGTGYTEDAAIAALQQIYPNLVDHQRCGRDAIVWRGQQQELDYVEAERGRLPEQRSHLGCTKQLSWMNSILQLTCNCWSKSRLCKPYFANPATEVIITGRCQKSCLFRPSWGSPEFCHKHYANH